MSASPLSFSRGASIVMHADLSRLPASGLGAQLVGDAHLHRFAAHADHTGNVFLGPVEFEQTVRGPWEWDVKRLATTAVLACREQGGAAADCRVVATAVAEAYRDAMRDLAAMPHAEAWWAAVVGPRSVVELVAAGARECDDAPRAGAALRDGRASGGSYAAVREPPLRLGPGPDLLPVSEAGQTLDGIAAVVALYAASLRHDHRLLIGRYDVVDAALWGAGVGSSDRRRFLVLIEGRDPTDAMLLCLARAEPSALQPYVPRSPIRNQAQRIVAGQQLLAAFDDPFLGLFRDTDGIDYYARRQPDVRFAPPVGNDRGVDLGGFARLCAATLARGHARSGDRIAIADYLGPDAAFDDAIGAFALGCADQVERDHAELVRILRRPVRRRQDGI